MSDNLITNPAQEGEITEPGTNNGEGRTFSQDEVNRIVAKRVTEEQGKAASLLAEKEADIARREFTYHANKTLEEKKLPPQLLDVIKADDTKMFDKHIGVLARLIEEARAAGYEEAATLLTRGITPPAGDPTTVFDGDSIRGAMGLDK